MASLLIALVSALCWPAFGAEGDASGAAPRSLVVHVDAGSSGLSPDEIRAAIGQELGVETAAGGEQAGALSVHVVGNRAGVSFVHPSGQKLVRWIDLPRDRASRVEVIALLAGNLARDEAASLLAGLKKPAPAPEPEQPEPAQSPPPPPPAEPAPSATPAPRRAPAEPAAAPPAERTPADDRFANLSLFHPISLVGDSERHTFALELGLAYGRIGALGGVGIDVGHLRVDGRARGAIAAGLWTHVGGDAHGLFASGVLSSGGGALGGVELAGVAAFRQGKVEGFQSAGVLAYAAGVDGAQLSVVNVGWKVRGVQLGLVNVGADVSGSQIGLVNVADRVDGVPLGLVNVIKEGRTQAVAWADTQVVTNAAVKYLNGLVYTLVGAGYDGGDGAAAAFGVGAHVGVSRAVYLELDILYRYVSDFEDTDADPDQHMSALRALVGLEGLGPVGVFAGGGVGQEVEAGGTGPDPELHGVLGLTLF